MPKDQSTMLDDLLPGMQHAFFDTVWPAFKWLKGIWIKENKGQFHLFVETTAAQDANEWSDFDYLAGQVFQAAERLLDELQPNSKHKISYSIRHGRAVPKDLSYRELMTPRVFRMIAKRHAPWRLERSR